MNHEEKGRNKEGKKILEGLITGVHKTMAHFMYVKNISILLHDRQTNYGNNFVV